MYITKEQWKESDAQAKADFTASTVAYAISHGHTEEFKFYEEDDYHNLVPFGDQRAAHNSRIDVYFTYGILKKYAELKGRRIKSNDRDKEGKEITTAFLNLDKIPEIRKKIAQGYVVYWVELYIDGKVRIWNLNKIDEEIGFENLKLTYDWIKEITIDPDSPKTLQPRYHLPYELATIIDRKPGTYAS